jgi:hypothetical protein
MRNEEFGSSGVYNPTASRPTTGTTTILLSSITRIAEIRQLSPSAAGEDPDCAIAAKGDNFTGCQSCYLFDLAIFTRS